MERIGIFGGTFDPPHIGHIGGAQCAIRELELDRLLLIPSGHTPTKATRPDAPSAEQRLQMAALAAVSEPKIMVSDLELRRDGESYTWETVAQIRAENPEAELFLILGTDMLLSFPNWVNADSILGNVSIAVLPRGLKGEESAIADMAGKLREMGAKVTVLTPPVCPISSTQLRRLLAFGCGDFFLAPAVMDYIRSKGLYHVNDNWRELPMEQLEPIVVSLLHPGRVRHVLGCRDAAVELAKRWGADETDAARAGILHDITKALDGPLQLTLCEAYGKILSDFSRKYPKTLHALTGSLVAERVFGENPAVVSAICHHTTGKADMNLLETIIYVADYMEPNRDFPGVEELRELAYTDIRAALKMGLEMTLVHLKNQGNEVSPASREALASLTEKMDHSDPAGKEI